MTLGNRAGYVIVMCMSRQPSIALISLQNSFIDFGIRYIASACRKKGIRVEILWILREPEDKLDDTDRKFIADWIKTNNFDLVGIGLMSLVYSRAAKLTTAIHKHTDIPVVWGGVHPILSPEQSLEWADFICTGDGEIAVPKLVESLSNGGDYRGLDNIWYRDNNEIIKTPRVLIEDLDSVAIPDFDLEHHQIYEKRKINPLTVDRMRKTMPWGSGRYYIISSRGCPYHCTYCINSVLQKLFNKKHFLRVRSVDNLMDEIRIISNQFPFLDVFAIMDDSFFFKPDGWIENFCDQFQQTKMNFGCLMHPGTVTAERVQRLVKAGLIGVQMGLQSGSEFISQQVFNRPEPVSEFIRATKVLDEFTGQIQARTYDVIVDNPFATEKDQEETIRVLASLNKPFLLDLFSLTLYPGSELFERAKNEGKLSSPGIDFENKNYLKIQPTIFNRLTYMTHTTPEKYILFLLNNRRKWWGQSLFFFYYHLWENGIRPVLRHFKHRLLTSLSHITFKPIK